MFSISCTIALLAFLSCFLECKSKIDMKHFINIDNGESDSAELSNRVGMNSPWLRGPNRFDPHDESARLDNRVRLEDIIRPRARCDRRIKIANGVTRVRDKGTLVRFQCSYGFYMLGASVAICVSGQWSDPLPSCVRGGCRAMQIPLHGSLRQLYEGGVAVFTCNYGYLLDGERILTCDGQKWNGTAPTCVEIPPITIAPPLTTFPPAQPNPTTEARMTFTTTTEIEVPTTDTTTSTLPTTTASADTVIPIPPIAATVAPITTTVPPITTTVPPITTTVPPITTTVPPITTTVPPITTTVPPITTTVPPITTTTPAITTTIPRITTTVPPITSTVPPITTTIPPITTTTPPITTTIPTTTMSTTLKPISTIAATTLTIVVTKTTTTNTPNISIASRTFPPTLREASTTPRTETDTSVIPQVISTSAAVTTIQTATTKPTALIYADPTVFSTRGEMSQRIRENEIDSRLGKVEIIPEMLGHDDREGSDSNRTDFGHLLVVIGVTLIVIGLVTIVGGALTYYWRRNKGIVRPNQYDLDGRTLSTNDGNDEFLWLDSRDSGL